MPEPSTILSAALKRASQAGNKRLINDETYSEKVAFVARNPQNRAGARLLLACLLAKIHTPRVNIRKPYTEIGSPDCYSGRTYDEQHVGKFVSDNKLPCNSTTAFLTPALRNQESELAPGMNLEVRPETGHLGHASMN